MRTIKKYFYLLAAVALIGMVSCVKEKEEFTPGDPDSETCEGVYFIKQDIIEETQIFDPTQDKKARIIVRRTNSDGALTVTPKVGLSAITSEGTKEDDPSLFTVSDIVFADGQEESYVDLEFSKVKEGVQYSLHLSIEGDEYSSKYSSSLKCCDFKVLCVAYKTFSQPKVNEDDEDVPARVTFSHGWWQEKRTALIKYYEVDGVRHCVTYDEKLVGETNGAHEEKGGFWGVDPDQHLSFLWFTQDIEEGDCADCEEGHPHTIPAGYPVPEGGELMTFDGVQEFALFSGQPGTVVEDYYYYQLLNGYSKGFLHFIDANSLFDNACYYDGNGGFYFWVLGYAPKATPGSGWAFPQDFDIVGIADGFTRADHTLELTAGMPEADDSGENVVPVDFKVGADVDLVAYTILKGNVSSALINNEATAIVKDTISRKYATWVEAKGESFSDMISCDETGMYTLVAVAIDTVHVKTGTRATDDAGVKYEYKHKNTASVYFKYLKAGDAGQVVLSVEAATTKGLESQGWNPETSLQYTIKGSGITGAIPMVYSQAEVEAEGGIEALVESLKSTPNDFYSLLSDEDFTGALSADQLACVNDNGFSSIYDSGVTPGTVYYVIVWATNGYDTAIEYATMTTAGDPLPIYMNYTYKNRKDELIDGKSASDFFGTYNLYAIDMYGNASLRSYMGQAVLGAYDAEKYGIDVGDSEVAQISGLSCGQGGDGFDDTILLEFCENPFEDDGISDKKGFFSAMSGNLAGTASLYTWVPLAKDWYSMSYNMVAYPVAEGYIAFVAESYYADNYGMNANVNFYKSGVVDVAFQDFLLVDPAKDNNPHYAAAVSGAKRAKRGNKVELPENNGFIRFDGVKTYPSHFISILEVKGLAPVQTIQRVEAGHKLSILPPMTVKEYNTPTVPFSARNI